MMLLRQFALLGLSILASVRAQSTITASASKSSSVSSASGSSSSKSSSTSTSSSAAATHTVSVGADGLNYSPNSLTANTGDIIEFRFYPQNHSVARAEYKQACIPYEDTGAGKVGFWSGFEPIAIVSNNPPIYNLLINDTEPIFFYCSAPGACIDGMVGVINPNDTQTLNTQLAYAENSTFEFSPNEYFPKETSPASSTSTSSSDSITTSSHKTFPPGAIAGIVVGAVALIVLGAALLYMCGRHRTMKEIYHNGPSNGAPTNNNAFDNNHNSYMSQGANTMSEANYPNMGKISPGLAAIDNASGRFSPHHGAYTETDTNSFRSRSPPVDEVGMQTIRNGQYQSVSIGSPMGSPGFPSPAYNHESHLSSQQHGGVALSEMDDRSVQEALRMQEKESQNNGQGPIELPVPSRSMSMNAGAPSPERERPFSYTDSESGYAGMMRDNSKIR